tara:strand:+ start:48 stop:593 length:546 start_codon:yes stop_codon:yes gene_type:complete
MKTLLIFFFITFYFSTATASVKENIIKNLNKIQNLNFNFEQNINGKIETGNCTIEYPKKIFCSYKLENKKILVSNGKSVVIKTSRSYYRYPLKKTPLKVILDKNFLINKISNLNERIIDDKFINYTLIKDDNEINIFFDIKTYNLIGWQILDIYQNLNITHLSMIKKNQILKKNLFRLPSN